jgi:salicylate biosynthesis isochorismate synthase
MAVRASTRAGGPLSLPAAQRATLLARCRRAVQRARRGSGEALAAVTLRVAPGTDPSAVAFASRREGEPWFCFEQPDRDGAALAALGCARAIRASGPRRFTDAGAAWRELAAAAEADPAEGPAGAGLVAVGGVAFAPDGGAAPPGTGAASPPRISSSRRWRSRAAATTCG